MANFPSNPSNGNTHTIGNTIWVYNSTSDSWLIQDVNEYAVANLENTPPANPDEGTIWYDSQTTGRLYIYIDGNWIDASPGDVSVITGGNDITATKSGTTYTLDVDDSFVRNTGDTMTGTLTMSGVTPEIHFNGTSDAGIDMAIKATPEGLDFYEPEDNNKVQFQILDDAGVNSVFGYKVNGTTVIDSSRNLTVTNGTFDNGTSTLVNVKCDNGGNAIVRAGGDGQGTGVFEVTQDNGSHGGGMSYNGDGSPAFVSGEGADRITFYRIISGSRSEVFSYAYNGNTVDFNGTVRSAGDLIAFYSDERLKTFEGPIGNALDIVDSLTGYYYTGNEVAGELGYDTESRQVGVSAQEVEAVLPEVVKSAPVNRNKDTDYKTVQYEKLVPVLIEAIKELRSEIETLKANKVDVNGGII